MLKLKLYFSTLGKGKLFENEDPPETISPSISDIFKLLTIKETTLLASLV